MSGTTSFLLLLAALLLGMSAAVIAGTGGVSLEASVQLPVDAGAVDGEQVRPGLAVVDGPKPPRRPRAGAEPSVGLAPAVAPPVPPPEA